MSHPIPKDALDDRLGFIGTSGSGKTYNAGGAVERLLGLKSRVVIRGPRRPLRQGMPKPPPVVVPPKLIWPQHAPRPSMTAEENARRMQEYMQRAIACENISQPLNI